MVTFNFSDDFTSLEKKIYRKACHVACRVLGVDRSRATVSMMLMEMPGHNKAAIDKTADDQYKLAVNRDLAPADAVFSIGHELIHFAQFIRGDLDVRPSGAIKWRGQWFDPVDIKLSGEAAYLRQPWEVQAFALHDELFKVVASQLSLSEREALTEEFMDRSGDHEILMLALIEVIKERHK